MLQRLSVGLTLALAAVSICIWVAVLRVWRRDGSILSFEARRAVPWGPIGLIMAGIIFYLTIATSLDDAGDDAKPTTTGMVVTTVVDGLLKLFVGGGVAAWLLFARRTTRADLGLPASLREGMVDFILGALAALASLVPVYVLLHLFVLVFGERPQHPLITRILENPSGLLYAAAFVSAVVVAPVFEEFVFRLLTQGWLERIFMPSELFVGGKPRRGGPTDAGSTPSAIDPTPGVVDVPSISAEETSKALMTDERSDPPERVRIYWMPILITSLLFSGAHYGFEYGYSPIPLFLLAIVLGYVYQRTHRILPCIAAHMTFNGISMILLWLQILQAP